MLVGLNISNAVKPVLETTGIKRPPAVRDHFHYFLGGGGGGVSLNTGYTALLIIFQVSLVKITEMIRVTRSKTK